MSRLGILAALIAALILCGCASQRQPQAQIAGAQSAGVYHVSPSGGMLQTVKAASDPTPGPGPKELAGVSTGDLLNPFQFNASLIWTGESWNWAPPPAGPSAVVVQSGDPCAAPSAQYVQPRYVRQYVAPTPAAQFQWVR